MKPHILITNPIPQSGIEMLSVGFNVEVGIRKDVTTEAAIIEKIFDKEVLLPLLTEAITAEIMDAAPNLKIISNYAVGYNNIDVAAATERGILVTNTPGVLTETTADCAFAMLMALGRRISESERFIRAGHFQGWEPMMLLGQDIYNKTLGIIGFGRIGQAMAKRAGGFDMKVIYNNRKRVSPKIENQFNASYVSLETLLKESDYISIHTPLLAETHHLISDREFDLMKPTSMIINTARGPVIDEKALIKALKTNKISGAALDVFEKEPMVPDEMKKLDNILIIPHIGSATLETRSRMSNVAAQNIINAFEGKLPVSLVNQEVLGENRLGL